jgi:magnesium-transporting ATPase (P-type)
MGCATQPAAYTATYQQMAENGMRVLALAYRPLQGAEVEAANNLASTGRGVAREDLEKDLLFAGFVAFSCKVRCASAVGKMGFLGWISRYEVEGMNGLKIY